MLAAAEQGPDARLAYLRRLREGLLCERKRLDHAEALIAEAAPAGLDRARFEIDLRSNASVEAFGNDLEEVRSPSEAAVAAGATVDLEGGLRRLPMPSAAFAGPDGLRHEILGWRPYDEYRAAAIAAGAAPASDRRPEPLEVIERFGRVATRELEEICGRPRPPLEAELWALAREWRLRPVTVLTGTLWELA